MTVWMRTCCKFFKSIIHFNRVVWWPESAYYKYYKCYECKSVNSGFQRVLKGFEFQTYEFKAWKVLKNKPRSLKVIESKVYGDVLTIVLCCFQKLNEKLSSFVEFKNLTFKFFQELWQIMHILSKFQKPV